MRSGPLIGGIAVYNVVQNTLLTDRGYVVGNVLVAAGALSWARRSDIGWSELGLDPESMVEGLATGAAVGTAAAVLTLAIQDSRPTRALFDDERLTGIDRAEMWHRLLVRFPLGTALFEEVLFRGVLPAAFPNRPVWQQELISAGVFAVWHIIPTSQTVAANREGRSLAPGRKATAVVGGSLAAGLAGLGFSALKRVSSSLAAPWLAHATINGLTLALAMRANRRAAESGQVRS